MEERLNEALDLIDELTQQLDEQTDELTMAKDTATELEAKAAAQDKVRDWRRLETYFVSGVRKTTQSIEGTRWRDCNAKEVSQRERRPTSKE